MDHKRAWLYCRVACSGPHSAAELEMQQQELVRCAKEYGLEIVGASQDIGTGLTLDRPGLQEFMDAVEAESVDVLLLTDLARLGRDVNKVFQLWHLLRGRGVHTYIAGKGAVDLSYPHMPGGIQM